MERKVTFPYTIKGDKQVLYLRSVDVYHEDSLLFYVELNTLSEASIVFGKIKCNVDTRKGGDYLFVRKEDLHFAYKNEKGKLDTGISCSSIGIKSILVQFKENALEIMVEQREEFPKLRYQTDYRCVGVI